MVMMAVVAVFVMVFVAVAVVVVVVVVLVEQQSSIAPTRPPRLMGRRKGAPKAAVTTGSAVGQPWRSTETETDRDTGTRGSDDDDVTTWLGWNEVDSRKTSRGGSGAPLGEGSLTGSTCYRGRFFS